MTTSTKKLARAAMMAALGVAILYISAVVPTVKLALVAIAGLLSAVALISCGRSYALAVFAVTATLALIILPTKGVAVVYACFLGYYPILKSPIEHIKKRPLQWALKLIVFNVVFALLWLLVKELLTEAVAGLPHLWLIAQLAGNAVFVLYDICLSRLIHFYILRFSKYFK